jgi:hypothetical protein
MSNGLSEYEDRQDNTVSDPAWISENARNLLDRNSDLEIVATIRRDSSDPAGQYVSDPDEMPLTSRVEEFKGRISVTLSGLVTLVKPKDKALTLPDHAVRTRLNFFRLSPDRRNKLVYDEDGKPTGEETNTPDAATMRWVEAREAYRTAYGEEAKKDLDIVTFLTERPIHFVLFQGNKGLGVSKVFFRK